LRFFTFTQNFDLPALIWPVPALRHQSLQPHAAGGAEEVGADLALLERRDEDALRSAGK
jgi:hypothetical protein